MTELLLPTRSAYRTGDPVGLEVRGLRGALRVWHLGRPVTELVVENDGVVDLGPLPAGGYGIELDGAHTAVDVHEDPRRVLRYGFVVDYRPGRDVAAVQANLRRLHLTAVQFYDWAYRHADLLGGGEQYADALGQPVSLATVRALVQACREIGADALGYAAVYASGPDEWPKWQHDALLTPSGAPYGLGDFLFLVDPAATDWSGHFTGDLADAVARIGFDGFHLDQYGYPKRAVRGDGRPVDVSASFAHLIASARSALPDARLVFNNVNDFPTWATGSAEQDAVYVEVWPPHVGVEHLADVATRARAVSGGKPVVIAAYQHVYDSAPVEAADLAARFTMATLFSHGATHLLCGEADRILVDPYYVRNHVVEPSTADVLHRWYDFAVAHGELLFDPAVVDVTGSVVGEYNDDVEVDYPELAVDHHAVAGTVWRRVTRIPDGRLAVHLINLAGQDDTRWDGPRNRPAGTGGGILRVRRSGPALPRVGVASPDGSLRLIDVEGTPDGDHATYALPDFLVWQLLLIDFDAEGEDR